MVIVILLLSTQLKEKGIEVKMQSAHLVVLCNGETAEEIEKCKKYGNLAGFGEYWDKHKKIQRAARRVYTLQHAALQDLFAVFPLVLFSFFYSSLCSNLAKYLDCRSLVNKGLFHVALHSHSRVLLTLTNNPVLLRFLLLSDPIYLSGICFLPVFGGLGCLWEQEFWWWGR